MSIIISVGILESSEIFFFTNYRFLVSQVPISSAGNNLSLEKLKCIPGFNPELTLDQMNSMIENVGCFAGYSQVDVTNPWAYVGGVPSMEHSATFVFVSARTCSINTWLVG